MEKKASHSLLGILGWLHEPGAVPEPQTIQHKELEQEH
jgi:hypothetical protein